MILVVGSMASGKRSFLRSLGYDDASMADAVIDGAPVVFNVQDLVRTRLEEGADAAAVSSELFEALRCKEALACTEVGSGLVPLQADQRQWREVAGRLQVLLAQEAQTVVRMVCGIPQCLKGRLPERGPCA